MFTRLSPLGSIFSKCSSISLSIRNISRARFLLGLSSDAKSYVLRGLPSSPLWQYEQRTPKALVNPIITGRSREPGQSFGKTCRFFGFSGQLHASWPRAEAEQRTVMQAMPRNLTASTHFIELPPEDMGMATVLGDSDIQKWPLKNRNHVKAGIATRMSEGLAEGIEPD